MNKVVEFFSKWGFVAILGVIGVALLFALGCSVYTAITNPFVGVVGTIANLLCVGVVAGVITAEIKEGV